MIFPSVTTMRLMPPPRTLWLEDFETPLPRRSGRGVLARVFLAFAEVGVFLGIWVRSVEVDLRGLWRRESQALELWWPPNDPA